MLRLGLVAISLAALLTGGPACGGGLPEDGNGDAPDGGDRPDGARVDEPDGGGDGAPRYLPLAVGASWTYRVVDLSNGASTLKTQTVEAYEDVGGAKASVMAFRVRTDNKRGHTLSWQEDTGTAIVRHREQTFDLAGTQKVDEWYSPSKLRLDESPEHLVVDATYSKSYTQQITHLDTDTTTTSDRSEQWIVEAVGEEIEVPAGTFTCLRIFRSNDGTGVQKRYWFALGVGKIKEEGGSQIEALTDHSTGP